MGHESTIATEYAPAERESDETIQRQFQAVVGHQCMGVMDAMSPPVLVLNDKRQVVYANRSFVRMLGADDPRAFLGLRPGEAVDCIHADANPGGCGTSKFCRHCGAVRAILSSIEGVGDVRECRLMRKGRDGVEALDLSVAAEPLVMDDERFTVFTMTDISHEKRRRALERIFFHDILNLAGGMRGLMEMLTQELPDTQAREARVLSDGFNRLLEEIRTQKDLAAAEGNELVPFFQKLEPADVMRKLLDIYAGHEAARGRTLRIAENGCEDPFVSDATLLARVLGNMVKNALEATDKGGEVTIGCRRDPGGMAFWVHNPASMAPDVRVQVFKRSFSTKGSGRGLGTYSMRLLAERYLGGVVDFTSVEDEGTTFTLTLPPEPPERD